MNRKEIEVKFNEQRKVFTDNVHSLIANNIGVKKLYTESNLWCEITDIDLRFKGQITISTSTFTYKIEIGGHEILEYRFGLNINNAPEYKRITKGDIESNSTDLRGRIETTNNLLKSIMSVKKDILILLEDYINFDFKLKEL
ncbi:MAG: hypothetical protein ACRCXT_15005 [Paraclostridium sp.]